MRLIADLPLQVPKLFFSKTLQNTGIVFSGNIIAGLFSLMTVWFLSRYFGPEIFGAFSLVGSVTFLIVSLTDFGVATSLSRFISPIVDKSSKKAVSLFRTVFWLEAFLGLAALLIGFIFLNPVSDWLGKDNIKGPLILGVIAAGVLSFSAYTQSVLQALQKFWSIALFSALYPLLKLTLIFTFFLFGTLSLWNALLINIYAGSIILLMGFLFIPKYFSSKINFKEDLKSAKELFSFSKWLAISYVLTAIAGRLDIIVLSHFRTIAEVGHYALAFQLSMGFPLLLSAMTTVLIPKVTGFISKEEIIRYIRKSLTVSVIVLFLAIPLILLAPFVINLVFGRSFIPSAPIFQVLALKFMLALIINPISYIFYTLNKPYVLTAMNFIFLIILMLLFNLLIPLYSGYGAAVALTINTFAAGICLGIILFIYYKQGEFDVKRN